MLDRTVTANEQRHPATGADVVEAVRKLSAQELAPIVQRIDSEGYYPENVMRSLGRAGAFARHLPGEADGRAPISSRRSGRWRRRANIAFRLRSACGARTRSAGTSSPPTNEALKADLGRRVAAGEALGGTALSNPMKTFFGIESIRLKGQRVDGGYVVRGALPFVSNLGD